MSSRTQIPELVSKYIDGALDEQGSRELSALLSADDEARRIYVQEMRLHTALLIKGRSWKASSPVTGRAGPTPAMPAITSVAGIKSAPPVLRTTVFRRIVTLAASLAILIGGAVLLLDWQKERSSIATLHSVTASVTVTHENRTAAAREGMRLFAGDFVQAAQPGESRIEYRGETTTLVLSKECCMRLDMDNGAKNVDLQRGVLTCSVAKQPAGKPMRFVTPHAKAEVIGTRLILSVADLATRLEVSEGSVRLTRNDQASVTVNAGEFAVVAQGVELKAQSLRPVATPQAKATGSTASATNHFVLRPDGFTSDSNFFPVGVWLQDPADAKAYKAAGINVYVCLWQGPTEEDLSTLSAAGMRTICARNRVGLKHLNDETIIGWSGCSDPDGAKFDAGGECEAPLDASIVIDQYDELKSGDPSRPVCITLGEGAAMADYPGRGSRMNHPGDYSEYAKGGDILNLHVYPINDPVAAIRGKLWYVPAGVENLRTASANAKPVWSVIECTERHESPVSKPTPAQVRSEVWMALIHGANGIVYFCHSWPLSVDSAALLHDPTMLAAVSDINHQIASLAPVLNSPALPGAATVKSSNESVPVDLTVRKYGDATYIFAVVMRDGTTTATFAGPFGGKVEVLGENRSLEISGGKFNDQFASYGVHLYKVSASL